MRGDEQSLCEPCGDCWRCRRNFKARDEVKTLRRQLATAIKIAAELDRALDHHLDSMGEHEVVQHPGLRAQRQLQIRFARFLARSAEASK